MTRQEGPYVHLPLSVNQERVLLARELNARNATNVFSNNLVTGIMLTGPLDCQVLERTLNEILRRHSSLRSSILNNLAIPKNERQAKLRAFARTGLFDPGMYLQSTIDDVRISIHVVDLTKTEAAKCDDAVRSVLQEQRTCPFDYRVPPLMRAYLVKLEEARHILLLIVDHGVADGWSMRIIHKEVQLLYVAILHGGRTLADIPISFADFTAWQNRMFQTRHFDDDARYWREQWAEFGSARIGPEDLPFALPLPEIPNLTFGSVRGQFDSNEIKQVREFVRRSRSTLYVLFLTALIILLRHYTGKKRLAIWAHFSNRIRPEVEYTVGLLANSHLLGFVCENEVPCGQFLNANRSVVMNASMHQEMPLTHLWKLLRCRPRVGDARLLIDVHIMPDENENRAASCGDLHFQTLSLPDIPLPRFSNLGVYVEDRGKELTLMSQYANALFPGVAVAQMVEDVKLIVMEIITNPEQPLSSFAYLAERYSCKCDPIPCGMDEFVVAGSDLIPHLSRFTPP